MSQLKMKLIHTIEVSYFREGEMLRVVFSGKGKTFKKAKGRAESKVFSFIKKMTDDLPIQNFKIAPKGFILFKVT